MKKLILFSCLVLPFGLYSQVATVSASGGGVATAQHNISWTNGQVFTNQTSSSEHHLSEGFQQIGHILIEDSVDESSTMLVYPNPAMQSITVKSTEAIKSIEIFNIAGRLIYSNSDLGQSAVVVDLANMAAQSYFMKILDSESNLTIKKFIKY